MKFESINNPKFDSFLEERIAHPNLIFGGYPGETVTSTTQDQIKSGGDVDHTENGSNNGRNDGFTRQTSGNNSSQG